MNQFEKKENHTSSSFQRGASKLSLEILKLYIKSIKVFSISIIPDLLCAQTHTERVTFYFHLNIFVPSIFSVQIN